MPKKPPTSEIKKKRNKPLHINTTAEHLFEVLLSGKPKKADGKQKPQ